MNTDLVTQFRALADPTRLLLLGVLFDEELTVGELAEVSQVRQSSVSRHLAALREAGLVIARKQGAMTFYRGSGQERLLGDEVREQVAALARRADVAQRLERVLERRRQRTRSFFDGAADSWDTLRGELLSEAAMLWSLIPLVPRDLSVVDIGTGTGAMLPYLAEFAGEIAGVDMAEGMLEAARRRASRLGLQRVSFHKADLEQLPFVDERFDAAFAVLALHHAVRPARAVAEMGRVVKPGGVVVILDLCAHGQEWLRAEQADLWLGFTQEEMTGLLERAGLVQSKFRIVSDATDREGRRLQLFVASARKQRREAQEASQA